MDHSGQVPGETSTTGTLVPGETSTTGTLTGSKKQIDLRILVDSEIVLSTRYGKTRVFINKTLLTETTYQQDLNNRDLLSTSLIVGKLGPGMWSGNFKNTSNVLVCETQRKVNMYGLRL